MEKTSDLIWQDTQHQSLFKLIDDLKTLESASNIFEQLSNYAENHFCIEEAYMKQLNYPRMMEHIDAHNKFRTELKVMTIDHHKFDEQVRESISTFLREWLTRHVLGIDKDFEAFVLSSKYK